MEIRSDRERGKERPRPQIQEVEDPDDPQPQQALNPCLHLEVPQKHLKPLEPQLEGLLNLSLTLTQIE
jgi:hypothetical protein